MSPKGPILGRGVSLFLLGGLIAANVLIALRLYADDGRRRDTGYEEMGRFTRVLEQVRAHYVDPSRAGYDQLLRGALSGMLGALDPHCEYMERAAYDAMKDDTTGQFGGLGLMVNLVDGAIVVVSPMEDSPAHRAGIMPGDRIVAIDGRATDAMDLEDAVQGLRGKRGTEVLLKILRPRSDKVREVRLVREDIQVRTVKDPRIVADGVGYLRVTQFSEPTADLLKKEIDRLEEQGVRALVLDLRNNPGGLLSSAIEVSQLFLERGDEVVSTLGRSPDTEQVYKAKGRNHYRFPVAVLLNRGSASASEIVAGALQDHKRAILVGEKSFGKGSVQSVVPLDDGSAIRLTTAKYYTPSHRVIHERGIEPDVVVPMAPEDVYRAHLVRSLPLDLRLADLAPGAGMDEEQIADPQLDRASDLLRGVMTFSQQARAE